MECGSLALLARRRQEQEGDRREQMGRSKRLPPPACSLSLAAFIGRAGQVPVAKVEVGLVCRVPPSTEQTIKDGS